jgi:hypothetical protein
MTDLSKMVEGFKDEYKEIPQNEPVYEWCCDCALRHIHFYRIVKNKKGRLVIQRQTWRDNFATELMRSYEEKVEQII